MQTLTKFIKTQAVKTITYYYIFIIIYLFFYDKKIKMIELKFKQRKELTFVVLQKTLLQIISFSLVLDQM